MLDINSIYIPIIFTILATLFVWVVLNLLIKNKYKSSFITSVFFLLFFSYGHIILLAGDSLENTFGINADLYMSVNMILILIIVSSLFLKFLKNSLVVNSLFNFIAVGLLFYPIITIAQTVIQKTDVQKNELEPKGKEKIFNEADQLKKPNIYYIILDGYGRNDILQSVYGYDNINFIDELEKRGFFIAKKSRANYCQTLLSLSSTLNMSYLDNTNIIKESYRQFLSSTIKDNLVATKLRELGYNFVTFATGYSGTEIKNSDLYITPSFSLDEFQFMLIGTTPLYKLLKLIPDKSPLYLSRQRILYTIDKIPDVKTQGAPMFLFAHIVAPHPPFVLGQSEKLIEKQKNGIINYLDGSHYHSFNNPLMEEYKKNYISQLKEINKLILKMVDRILIKMERETIIILQSDHGPGLFLNWENPTAKTFSERLPIFNAYFFSNDKKIQVDESITPVNTFRVLFNNYFNCKYEILDNKSYFSTWSNAQRFINVDQYF